jgi:chorismate-pyruvate lyase
MSAAISSTAARAALEKFVLAHPLDEFYAQMGLTLPPLQQVDGEAVPQPYKRLLVHQNDMTPTLESFHGCDIHLRLLGRRRKGNGYFREVVLLLDGTDQPVEFGAIKISLDRFAPEVRRQILEERRPLGHVLQECGVKHTSRPKAFLRLASDHFINEALQLTGANVLYGRRNTLFDPQERPLAEIVEILPPAAERKTESAK